jgi:hypothetical protein
MANNSAKQAILTKLSSLKDKINADNLKNMTPEQRKQYGIQSAMN